MKKLTYEQIEDKFDKLKPFFTDSKGFDPMTRALVQSIVDSINENIEKTNPV